MVQASELLPGGHSIASIIFLRARLTARIDGHCRTRRRRRLDAMLHAAKDVGDIPMRGAGLAGHVLATLDVPRFHLLSAFATDVRADRAARERAADGCDVLAASAANLVTEDSAQDPADDRAADVGLAAILHDLLALDPAALLRWADHRAHGSHVRLEEPLTPPPLVVVNRDRWRRRIAGFLDAHRPAHRAHR